MKIRNTLPLASVILFLIIALASCQEDFSTLGSDIIGGQNINATLDNNSTVVSYSRKLSPVQTNDLPLYQLGTYNDPVFGKMKAELVAQLTLGTIAPSFGEGTSLDSVILYIPFLGETSIANEVTSYTIDSVYGSNPINVSIYESNYFLTEYDPSTGLQERQKYYSDLGTVFETPGNKGQLIYNEADFLPTNEGYVLLSPDGEDEDTEPDQTLLAPGLRAALPVTFFREKIIAEEGTTELMNNNNFKEYFRGLYFEVDDLATDGNLFLFNIADANVTLYYTYQDSIVGGTTSDPTNGDDVERLSGQLTLNFGGINVNLYDNEPLNPAISAVLENPNTVAGEENLYLRGGDGIVTLINLFGDDLDGNGVSDELDVLRTNNWLINEANLIFYVNQDIVTGGASEPERIIIYDAQNAQVLADYGRDPTISELPENALTGHLGKLVRGTDEIGDYYKIRITHHISNLIHKDSTNVPLSLIVTQNVLSGGFKTLKDPVELNDDTIDNDLNDIPSSSVISHEGTVLYGNNTSNPDKKLRLQIYYTEPN
jgi:hypothetical protein